MREILERATTEVDGIGPGQLFAALSPEDLRDIEVGLISVGALNAMARSLVATHQVPKAQPTGRTASGSAGLIGIPPSDPAPTRPPAPDPLATLEGLHLLPEDRRFLHRQLTGYTLRDRGHMLKAYRAVWTEAADVEPSLYRRDNAGRAAANAWLNGRAERQQYQPGHADPYRELTEGGNQGIETMRCHSGAFMFAGPSLWFPLDAR